MPKLLRVEDATEQFIDTARVLEHDGLQIDEVTRVAVPDDGDFSDGYWIEAWLHVPKDVMASEGFIVN